MTPTVLDEQATDATPVAAVIRRSDVDLEVGVAPASTPTTDQSSIADTEQNATQPPSDRLTGHQLFYIVFLHGLGGTALSAGANFAIAYAMYTTQSENLAANPIRLFQLPNTLAGDAAVPAIIQCIPTCFVEAGVVPWDLRIRSVQPLGLYFLQEPAAKSDSPWTRLLR
jgi:hypothetical protein